MGKFGMVETDLDFWIQHIPIDEHHGKAWASDMEKLITSKEQAEQVLEGGLDLLDARAEMYDALWEILQAEMQTTAKAAG